MGSVLEVWKMPMRSHMNWRRWLFLLPLACENRWRYPQCAKRKWAWWTSFYCLLWGYHPHWHSVPNWWQGISNKADRTGLTSYGWMLWIARRTMGSNCRVIPQHLFRLDRTLVTAPAYAFEVGRIVEQGQVAFMRFDVMNDRCAWIRASVR